VLLAALDVPILLAVGASLDGVTSLIATSSAGSLATMCNSEVWCWIIFVWLLLPCSALGSDCTFTSFDEGFDNGSWDDL
jgi:hypothetical protein